MNVDLRIGRLVLHGFPPHRRRAVGWAVQTELERLLTDRGVPRASDITRRTVDAGTFEHRPDAPVSRTGRDIALAVYGGLE